MESHNYLGIHITENDAAVVCVGKNNKINTAFSVCMEEDSERDFDVLAKLVKQGCSQRKLEFKQVVIAIDAAMYMQHDIHSDFAEDKQIVSTIHFDVEEAIADDVSSDAIAYEKMQTSGSGSDLNVYSSKKTLLSKIISSFRANGLNPVSVEPDMISAVRFLRQKYHSETKGGEFYCLLSSEKCYYAARVVTEEDKMNYVGLRTGLLRTNCDQSDYLAREITITIAKQSLEGIGSVVIFDSGSLTDYSRLGEKTGIGVHPLELNDCGLSEENTGEVEDKTRLLLAYGAGLYHTERSRTSNFRNDYMPYLGRKKKIEKAAKIFSAAAFVLILFIGVYFQWQFIKDNKPARDLKRKFALEYEAVMMGKKITSKPLAELSKEKRRIESLQSGKLSITGEQAISAKVTNVLVAFNKCASKTDLQVDKINVTPKVISITGSTSTRNNTLELIDTIKKSNLQVSQYRYDLEGSRDVYKITIEASK